jgi:hypothetical protein
MQNMDWLAPEPKEQTTEIVSANPYDIEAVKNQFEQYRFQITDMEQQAAELVVDGDGPNSQAVAMAGSAKKLAKQIDDLSRQIIADPNDFVKSVCQFAKGFTEPLGAIENGLKRKIADYQYKLRLEAQKKAEAERKAREELQKKLDAEAKKAHIEPVKLPDPIIQEAPKVTRTESGAAHIRMVWTAEVEDESKVPAEYKVIDMTKINRAVKDGVRNIPGVRVYEKPVTTIRT